MCIIFHKYLQQMTIDQYEGLADLSSLFLDRIQSDLALLALKHFEEIYD